MALFGPLFDANYLSKNGLNKKDEQELQMDLLALHTYGKGPCGDQLARKLLTTAKWDLKRALKNYFIIQDELKLDYIEMFIRSMVKSFNVKLTPQIAAMLLEFEHWNGSTAASLYYSYEEKITQISKRFTGGINVDAGTLKELEIFVKKDQEGKRKKNNKKKKKKKHKKNKRDKKKRKNINNIELLPTEGIDKGNMTAILPTELAQFQVFIRQEEILELKLKYKPTSDDKPTPNHDQALPQPPSTSNPTPDHTVASPTPIPLPKITSKNDAILNKKHPSSNALNPSNTPTPLPNSTPNHDQALPVPLPLSKPTQNPISPTNDKPTSDPPSVQQIPSSNTSNITKSVKVDAEMRESSIHNNKSTEPTKHNQPSKSTPDHAQAADIPTPSSKSTSNNKITSDTPNQPSKPTANNNVTSDETATTISTPDQPLNPTSHAKKLPYIHLKMPMLKYKYLERMSWQRELEISNEWEWEWEYDPPLVMPYPPSVTTNPGSPLTPSPLSATPNNDVSINTSHLPSTVLKLPLALKSSPNTCSSSSKPINELDPLLNKLKPTSDYDATQNTLHMPSNTPDPPSKPIPNNINMPPKPIPNNGNASDILRSSFKPTPNIQTTIETTKIPSKPMNTFGLSGGSMNKNKTDASPLAPITHTYCNKNKNKSDTSNPPSNPPSPSNKSNPPSFTFIQSSKQTPNNDVTLNKLNTPSNPSLKPTLTPTLKPISKYDTTINTLQPPTNTPDPPSNKLKPTSNKDATINLMSNPTSTLTLNPTLMSLTSSKPILNNESAPSKPIPNNGNVPAKLISNNDNASDILSLSFKPTANIKTTFETANGPSKPNLNNANVPSNTLNALKPTSEYDETLNLLQLPSNTPDPPSSTVKPTSDYAATPNTSPHYIKSLYTLLPPSKPPERSKKVVKNDSDPRDRDKYKMDIKGKGGSGGDNMDPRERDKSRIMGRYGIGDGNMDPRERDKDKLRDAYDDGNEPRDRDKFSGYNNYLLDNINDMIFRLSLNNWYLSAVGNPPYVTAALATLTLNMLYQVRDYVVCIVWLFMWNTRLYSVIILLLTAVGYHNYYVTAALTTKTLNLLNKMETEVDFGITYIFSKQITSGRDGLD